MLRHTLSTSSTHSCQSSERWLNIDQRSLTVSICRFKFCAMRARSESLDSSGVFAASYSSMSLPLDSRARSTTSRLTLSLPLKAWRERKWNHFHAAEPIRSLCQCFLTWWKSFCCCTLCKSPPIGCCSVSSWSARAIQSMISCRSINSWRHSVPVSSRRSRMSSVRTLSDCHLSFMSSSLACTAVSTSPESISAMINCPFSFKDANISWCPLMSSSSNLKSRQFQIEKIPKVRRFSIVALTLFPPSQVSKLVVFRKL